MLVSDNYPSGKNAQKHTTVQALIKWVKCEESIWALCHPPGGDRHCATITQGVSTGEVTGPHVITSNMHVNKCYLKIKTVENKSAACIKSGDCTTY